MEAKEKMTFKKGSFYRNGEKVPLEFGNKDQIDLIEKAKALSNDGVFIPVNFDDDEIYFIGYTCLCGYRVIREYKADDVIEEFNPEQFTCIGCGQDYLIEADEEIPFLIVKFDNQKKRKS